MVDEVIVQLWHIPLDEVGMIVGSAPSIRVRRLMNFMIDLPAGCRQRSAGSVWTCLEDRAIRRTPVVLIRQPQEAIRHVDHGEFREWLTRIFVSQAAPSTSRRASPDPSICG